MNYAIKVLENQINSITKGFHVAEVIGITDKNIFMRYRGENIFGRTSSEAKVGDIFIVSGTSSLSLSTGPNPVEVLENEFWHNCVDLDEKLPEELVEEVKELLNATEKLRREEFTLNTPCGKLIAYQNTDPDYPGISIDVVTTKENYLENAAVVEYIEGEGIVVHAWEQNKEDSVYRNRWSKNTKTEVTE